MKCPKCGSENVENKWGYETDPGDPSTIVIEERIAEWGLEAYTIRCKDCGYVIESDVVQPGYRD